MSYKSEIEERITLFIILLFRQDAGILPGRYPYKSLVLRDMVPQAGLEPATPGFFSPSLMITTAVL